MNTISAKPKKCILQGMTFVGILLELLLKEHCGIYPNFEVLFRVNLYIDKSPMELSPS
jgi:hypothetical protein